VSPPLSRLERREKKQIAEKSSGKKPVATNRRALHDFFVEERFEAGLVLTGTEVKSLRAGKANLKDGYVEVDGGEAWLVNVHVSPYEAGSYNNPDPERKRKLLLHRREIEKLHGKIQRSGATCIPLSLYFKGARAKAEIALVTGKKLIDKRESIRRRESEREARAAIKSARRV